MVLIFSIIVAVLTFIIIILGKNTKINMLHKLNRPDIQMGSKLMAAFLAGFIVFTLFTDKMPNPIQKIPVVIVSVLLIWANLFLHIGQHEISENENPESKT